jgi:hypothetical protein
MRRLPRTIPPSARRLARGGDRLEPRAAVAVEGGAAAFGAEQIVHHRDDIPARTVVVRAALERAELGLGQRDEREGRHLALDAREPEHAVHHREHQVAAAVEVGRLGPRADARIGGAAGLICGGPARGEQLAGDPAEVVDHHHRLALAAELVDGDGRSVRGHRKNLRGFRARVNPVLDAGPGAA